MKLKRLSIFIYLDVNYHKSQLKILTDNIIKKISNNIEFHFYMPNKLNLFYPKNSKLIIQKDLPYFLKMRDHRMYTGFLDYINKKKIDLSIIYRLEYPEFLLSDLNYFKKINSKIFIISYAYELNNRSEARSNLFVELIKDKNITKCIIPSILGNLSTGPKYFEKKISLIKKKIIKVSEFRCLKPENLDKNLCRKILKIRTKKFIILYLGQPYYGKGFDIFLKLVKNFKNRKILFYIQTNLKNVNFDLKNLDKIKKKENIIFRKKSVKFNLIKFIYGAVDAVCIPYRKSYKYGTSSIFLESILSSRPVIVPDFNPFKDILRKFKIGVLYKNQNITSLKKSIKYIFNNFNKFNFIKDRKNYLEFTNDYYKITDEIKKSLY